MIWAWLLWKGRIIKIVRKITKLNITYLSSFGEKSKQLSWFHSSKFCRPPFPFCISSKQTLLLTHEKPVNLPFLYFQDSLMQEEIFGPILPIITVKDKVIVQSNIAVCVKCYHNVKLPLKFLFCSLILLLFKELNNSSTTMIVFGSLLNFTSLKVFDVFQINASKGKSGF